MTDQAPEHIYPLTWHTAVNGKITTHERPMSFSSAFHEAFGEPYFPWSAVTRLIEEAVQAERERCAEIAMTEARAMQDVVLVHTPPRTTIDPQLAELHEQGMQVCLNIAAAIRAFVPGLDNLDLTMEALP